MYHMYQGFFFNHLLLDTKIVPDKNLYYILLWGLCDLLQEMKFMAQMEAPFLDIFLNIYIVFQKAWTYQHFPPSVNDS